MTMYPAIEYVVIDMVNSKVYTSDHKSNLFDERMATQFAKINNAAHYHGTERLVVFKRAIERRVIQ